MTSRQPSLAEVQKEFSVVRRYEGVGAEAVWYSDGRVTIFHRRKDQRRGRLLYFNLTRLFSDISKRCFDCNRVLVDRRDGMGRHLPIDLSGKSYSFRRHFIGDRSDFCLSCANRRRALMREYICTYVNRRTIELLQKGIRDAKHN